MRIVLLGNSGQIGWEAQRALSTLGEVVGLDYPAVDFTKPAELAQKIIDLRPQVIYNAVAYTAVDRAESEPERARLVNAVAPGALAEAAKEIGAVLIHFSSDYVFDGKKGSAYVENDAANPLSVYGHTKLEGDLAVQQVGGAFLIFRTTWVYSNRRESFVSKVLQWSEGKPSLRVVCDQVSGPTWARMLAEVTGQILARGGEDPAGYIQERSGLYHLAGDGSASRMEWAQAILANRPAGASPVEVLPALTSDFPTPAQRPLYSVLDCSLFQKTFGLSLPPWQKALRMAMDS